MRVPLGPVTLRTMTRCLSLGLLAMVFTACAIDAPDADESATTSEQALTFTPVIIPGKIVLSPTAVRGTLQCHGLPLRDAVVTIGSSSVQTDAAGVFRVGVRATGNVAVRVGYDATVASDSASSNLRVVDELKNGRSETVSRSGTLASLDGQLVYDLGVVPLQSLDCDLFRVGDLVLRDYHRTRRASPPTGKLQIKRQSDVHFGTAYTYYTMINIRTDWLDTSTAAGRERTLFHEFGHAVRHAADGPEDHWNWDNFRWSYARSHDGTELFNTQYAFNEGWAGFWEASRRSVIVTAPATANERHDMHFNEDMIVQQLLRDMSLPGSSRRLMVEVLEANPGTIHSLHDFERRLFARLGRAAPATPPSCPLGWSDDGATCRLGGDVVAKSSYGRGAGTPKDVCPSGRVNDGGLCYAPCPADHDGFATRCIQDCRPGYNDHGLTCFRDLFDWYWKGGYDRGVGTLPIACGGDKELNDGLCYDACRAGWSGGGPVCYSPCPTGWDDDGATCRRPLTIITKF